MRYLVEPMRLRDVSRVQEIETQSFSSPWSAQAYEKDLTENKLAHYLVLREISDEPDEGKAAQPVAVHVPASGWQAVLESLHRLLRLDALLGSPGPPEPPAGPIVGFAGIWLMVDEAHLVTIAVQPGHRGRGLGELLLVSVLDWACALGASYMTLEVRASNHVAQALYRKYGFRNEGVRRRYYSDNGEDAIIMTTDKIASASYQARYQELKREVLRRLVVEFRLP